MTLLGGHHKSTEQQHEVREARRLLKERTRNDWDFPPLPAYRRNATRPQPARKSGDDEARVAGFRFHTPRKGGLEAAAGAESDVVAWRERVCSSDTESDVESSKTTNSKSSSKSKRSEYKFEGPDSVGTQVRDRRTARRTKRRKELDKELSWNEGLEHWTRQRDAWTGARLSSEAERRYEHDAQEREMPADSEASDDTTPRTSTSSTLAEISSAATTPDVMPAHSRIPTRDVPPIIPLTSTVIPVCAPILPNHPIRRRISPSMYHEIYSKIILQSRTPAVPINLSNLIHALIEGWKADGEWPPKSGPLEPMIGRRKVKAGGTGESSLRSGVKSVAKVLRLTGTGGTSGSQLKEGG